ncbi:MAG: PEP-CTERM sorting domain-containing protein [Chthoniobacterales bacterium]
MKILASLLVTFTLAAPVWSGQDHVSPTAQRISGFVSGGLMPAMPQSGRDVSVPTIAVSNFYSTFDADRHQDNLQWSPSDFASVFTALSENLAEHHFDPQSLNDLQTFIDNLHLDPALIAKLQMIVQNFENSHIPAGDHDMGSGSGDNDDHGDMDDQGEDEHGDFDDDDMPVAVPEPSTLAAVLVGAALLSGTLLRRRAR